MSNRSDVRVHVHSRRMRGPEGQQEAPAEPAMIQELDGNLYQRADSFYLLYAEANTESGPTKTTVKIMTDSLRIVRHGETDSEIEYRLNTRMPGRIRTPFGILGITTLTHVLDIGLFAGGSGVFWHYDLYVEEEWTGAFAVSLQVEPR